MKTQDMSFQHWQLAIALRPGDSKHDVGSLHSRATDWGMLIRLGLFLIRLNLCDYHSWLPRLSEMSTYHRSCIQESLADVVTTNPARAFELTTVRQSTPSEKFAVSKVTVGTQQVACWNNASNQKPAHEALHGTAQVRHRKRPRACISWSRKVRGLNCSSRPSSWPTFISQPRRLRQSGKTRPNPTENKCINAIEGSFETETGVQ